MSCLYVYVGAEASIDQVAVDLRNQAPTVLIVCCSNEHAAARMKTALSEEAVNKQTRGDGGSRRSGEDFQVMFNCVVFDELIVAGRRPVVKEVDIKETLVTPGGGAGGFSLSAPPAGSIRGGGGLSGRSLRLFLFF